MKLKAVFNAFLYSSTLISSSFKTSDIDLTSVKVHNVKVQIKSYREGSKKFILHGLRKLFT